MKNLNSEFGLASYKLYGSAKYLTSLRAYFLGKIVTITPNLLECGKAYR